MAITHLILRDLGHRKARAALTVGAVALAGSLVVAMTSGFASLTAAAHSILGMMYGPVDVSIAPREAEGQFFEDAFVQHLRDDPRVAAIRPQLIDQAVLLDEQGQGVSSRPPQLIGIHPRDIGANQRHPLRSGEWFTQESGDVAVIDESIAGRRNVEPGQSISVATPDGPRLLTVTGISARPGMLRMEAPTIYLPLDTMQEIVNRPGRVNLIDIDLRPGEDTAAFAAEVQAARRPGVPPLRAKTVATQQGKFDQAAEGLNLLSYLGGTVSMIAAVFIIFSTLSMGVGERSRTLAMLRAIGAERSHVFKLVVAEGLILSLIGSLLGVALGYLWVTLLVRNERLFTEGVVFSLGGLAYGVAGSMTAALVASLIPAYAASRVDPLEAMAVVADKGRSTGPLLWAALGALLLAVDPAVVYAGDIDRELRIGLHLYVGLPCFMLGLFAVAPLVVVLVDATLGPVVAWLMALKPSLLRQQVGGATWRTAGTAAALMVGLVVLVLIRTHGQNMIKSWQLPDRFPDLLMIAPLGLDERQAEAIGEIDGIRDGAVLPVAIVSPGVGADFFSLAGVISAPSSTMMFGLDTDRAFGATPQGGRAMVELDFIEGSLEESRRLLREGRYVLVSEEFRKLKGLGVGDTLEIETTLHGKVDYTIAGVIRSPGIDLVVRLFNISGEFEQWTSAAVATHLSNVRNDFGVNRFAMLGANLDPTDDPLALADSLYQPLLNRGLFSTSSARIKSMIDEGLNHLLTLSSSVALMAMLVASVGVTNTVMASVRSRRWQLGVLRSMGLTRASLMRLVVAEAVLIALVATVLGLGGGLLLSYSAGGMAGHVVGVQPGFTVNFQALWTGAAITLGVSIAAALWPAIRVATSDTLQLLQAGRSAA